MKPSDFYTRKPSNKGAQMPLEDPATGKPSGEWLHVLGLGSDSFAAALAEKRRKALDVAQMPKEEQAAAEEDAELELYASLVTGWSFKEPFTAEGIKELFAEAPEIKLAVDKFASAKANFLQRPSKS